MRKLILGFALTFIVGFTTLVYSNDWDSFEQQHQERQQIAQQPMMYDTTHIPTPDLPGTSYGGKPAQTQQNYNREMRQWRQQSQQQQIYNQNVNTYNNNLYRQKRDH